MRASTWYAPMSSFQKSTNAGRTWLAEDVLIKRGDRYAAKPDITTDSDGNVYIAFVDQQIDTAGARDYHISCVRSTDGGTNVDCAGPS